MPEGAQGSSLVAGIQESGGDAAEIAGPDKVVDLVAVVIGLAPGRGGGRDEGAGIRLVLEAAQDRE
jgi:hypothetical protein